MDCLGKCAVVIPCWNEAATIGSLVERVRAQVPVVIVVDDGSTDATASIAAAAGAVVERHGRRQGKGAALRTGLHHALRLGCAWAMTLDGDGQHPPECIPALFAGAARTGKGLVVGDRMEQAARMPWSRGVANHWMSRQISRRAGRPLPDSQCGFRLLRLEDWRRLRIEADHFEVESETLLAFVAAGHPVEFVRIPVVPSPRASRIRVIPDTLRWLRWWCAWGSWRGLVLAARPASVRPNACPTA